MKFLLHRGLSFCDASVIDDTGQDSGHTRWLYSKHKFRSQIEGFLKDWADKVTEVVLLDEFADRLSGLRMGGSVAAVFPQGLEKLTQRVQSSPIHSESMIFSAPTDWSDEWVTKTLASLQKDTIKRIAWQTTVPQEVLARFHEAGFENFVCESLQPEMLQNWRRNLLNASCSGPVLELTEEIQTITQNLKMSSQIKWIDEDLKSKTEIKNRYGLTSVWTHLLYRWAQKQQTSPCDIFILDWDGCFHIGAPLKQRWTPWGTISSETPLPNVKLLRTQPTTTLEKNLFSQWAWLGKADAFEPGPVFLGRGLKPTVLDVLVKRDHLLTQFDVKNDFEEKTNRLLSSLSSFKNSEQVEQFKKKMSREVILQWSQNMLELAQSQNWLVVGPLAQTIQDELSNLPLYKVKFEHRLPILSELYKFAEKDS